MLVFLFYFTTYNEIAHTEKEYTSVVRNDEMTNVPTLAGLSKYYLYIDRYSFCHDTFLRYFITMATFTLKF